MLLAGHIRSGGSHFAQFSHRPHDADAEETESEDKSLAVVEAQVRSSLAVEASRPAVSGENGTVALAYYWCWGGVTCGGQHPVENRAFRLRGNAKREGPCLRAFSD